MKTRTRAPDDTAATREALEPASVRPSVSLWKTSFQESRTKKKMWVFFLKMHFAHNIAENAQSYQEKGAFVWKLLGFFVLRCLSLSDKSAVYRFSHHPNHSSVVLFYSIPFELLVFVFIVNGPPWFPLFMNIMSPSAQLFARRREGIDHHD